MYQATSRALILSSIILLLGACALKPRHSETQKQRAHTNSHGHGSAQITEAESSSDAVEANVERPYQSQYGQVSMDDNKYVDKWVRYFTGKGRKHMVRYLSRSSRYLPMMKNTLRENGLPEELVYVALIESGFSPVAHSHANAVGYWQFIRGTGKRYGLHIDGFIDERRDPVLSTKAAAEYFKTLYGIFGDWHLALAGYNAGENRILRATRRYRTKDFWSLVKQRYSFARETKNYVPKFIAAARIAQDPAKYGFDDVEYSSPLVYDTVALKHPISLSRLSQNLGVELDEMRLLNPKFRGDYVPISRGSETVIRLPVGRANDALAAVPLSVSSKPERVVSNEYFYYRIRRGDNLSFIAKRYRTSVSKLRRLNNLSRRAILRVGRRLKVPDPGGAALYANGSKSRVQRAQSSITRSAPAVHVVRRGENLSTIAQRYGTSVSHLLRLNNLSRRSIIRVGQRIKVRGDSSQRARTQKSSGYHIVRRGENLTTIAAQYGMSISDIKDLNRLRRSVIYAGQKLALKGSGSAAKSITSSKGKSNYHRVRRGETLVGIANRYDVSLSELAQANNFSTRHRVRAGRKLVIPD